MSAPEPLLVRGSGQAHPPTRVRFINGFSISLEVPLVRPLVDCGGMTSVKDSPPRPSRKQQALATRRRIVECAVSAFIEHGYAATTVESVAREAGVAVQTVYFTFRTKGELLQAAYEHVVTGPDGVPPHHTAWWRSAEQDPDVASAVRTLVEGTVELLDRAAPLVWAVLGDPTARERYDANEELRRSGNERLLRTLSTKNPLRDGLPETRACDLLLVLTGPQLYSQLTRDLGWSIQEVADWMTAAVLRELFDVEPMSQ
jgi:AcrR family transcriptional regulator